MKTDVIEPYVRERPARTQSASAQSMKAGFGYGQKKHLPSDVVKFRLAKRSVKACRRFFANTGAMFFSHPEHGMAPAKNFGSDFAEKRAAIFA